MSWEKPNKLNVLQKSLNLAGLCFYLIRTRKFGAICVDSGGNTKFVGLFNLWIRKYYGSFFWGVLNSFCIIEGPETVQDFMQLQVQEIRDNIRSRRNKIFLLMEEVTSNCFDMPPTITCLVPFMVD
jgi:hypothetical protein